jgi:DNA-binding NarL/FixJ family response regulator
MQPDVVLLDLAMPVMDGLQAIPEIRRIAPRSKIVVLTGFDENKVAEEATERGASAFLAKGVGPGEITDTIRRVCALPDGGEWTAPPPTE